MIPIHFGDKSAPLFGVFHPPDTAHREACQGGVLLCNSYGREAICIQRTLRSLAERLSARGLACLRFDYRGSGDSSGTGDELSLSSMAADIVEATRELSVRAGSRRVGWLAVRTGGTAAVTALERARPAHLYLWEPVFDGRAFAGALRAADRLLERPRDTGGKCDDAVLGHPFPRSFEEELVRFALPAGIARRVPIDVFGPTPVVDGARHVNVSAGPFGPDTSYESAVVPGATLTTIANRILA